MATNAMREQRVVRRVRPEHAAWDRIFFAVMILTMWAMVLVGFARTYFLAGMVRAPLPNTLIHIHGAAFSLWMVLLLVQTSLILVGKVKWHRTLGMAGFCLATLMVVLGLVAATDALRRGAGPLGLDAKTFYVIPVSDMLVFSVLVVFAFRARRKPAAHKRLILIATIALMDAAVGRWPVPFLQANPKMQDLVPLGLLLLVMAYDLISLKRIQQSTIWASVLLIVVHVGRVPLGFTAAWHAFATRMAALG